MTTKTQPLTRANAPAAQAQPGIGALLVLLAGIFLTTLDFFIVNVAIPATQRDLHAGPAAIQWVVAGFGLALAAGLVTGGRLGDSYGRRRMYLIGLGAFTVASLLCGAAPTAEVLVIGRIAQGVGAALLMPQVLGIITALFTGARRARAFAGYGLAMGFGGVFGQLIGGALIQLDVFGLGWRAIFLINVPVGLAAALCTLAVVPESGRVGSRLDLTGVALVSAGLVAIVLPLIQGPNLDWPAWTWMVLAAAPVFFAVFAVQQKVLDRSGGAPLVRPGLLADRGFSVGSVLALVYSTAMAGFFLVLALYLQQGRGMTALSSGLLFTCLGAGYFAASTVAPRVAVRLGRQVLALGAVVQAVGCGLLLEQVQRIGVTGSVAALLPGLVLAGAGMGLVLTPMSGFVLSDVDVRDAASAAGVLATLQQVGGALGVAVVGILFYGALGGGFGAAFTAALVSPIVSCLLVACLTQVLPRRQASA